MTAFAIARFYRFICAQFKKRKQVLEQYESLFHLTAQEKGYLACYILDGQNTVYVGLDDGVMQGLASKRITCRVSGVGNILQGFPFNLNDWARTYLEMNPGLLHGAIGEPLTPEERTFGRRIRGF